MKIRNPTICGMNMAMCRPCQLTMSVSDSEPTIITTPTTGDQRYRKQVEADEEGHERLGGLHPPGLVVARERERHPPTVPSPPATGGMSSGAEGGISARPSVAPTAWIAPTPSTPAPGPI